jgi:hypothetical protein
MKKILLSVLALLVFACSGMAQTLPSYVPTNGLVGWWPFNGNANDESGNNNNGTVNGATLTADRFGNAGKAYGFDQVSQQAITGTLANFGSAELSVSVWGKHKTGKTGDLPVNGFQPFEWLVGIGSPTAIAPTNEAFCFGVYNNSSNISAGGWGNLTLNGCTIDTIWKQYVVTFSQGQFKAYQNGQLTGTSQGQLNISSFPFAFGRQLFGINEFWNGSLDDIAIYNRALTQLEITSLYQGANTTANCPTFPASLTQGLVGYWPFCGNANDESGNGNHGTVNGATLTTDRFGNQGSAYSFDGVSNFINFGNSILNLANKASVSFWFKKTNFSNTPQSIYNKRRSLIGDGFLFGFSQNSCAAALNREPGIFASPYGTPFVEFDSTWNHVVVTWNDSILSLFLNGIKRTEKDLPSGPFVGNEPFYLGKGFDVDPGGGIRAFDGEIDDVAIWNRALSQQEITQLYNQGICQTSITVTDTLLIHTGITSYNPVAYGNTLKVWPNPGNTAITLDAGNLASMQGWKIRISNAQGVQIYPANGQLGLISQQQQTLSMSAWGGNGLYFLYLIDPQNNIQEVKKIVLAP